MYALDVPRLAALYDVKLVKAFGAIPPGEQFYAPEDLVGKKIIIVANLKPATLCGVESNGMILASGEETVRVVFLAEDTPLGERVR